MGVLGLPNHAFKKVESAPVESSERVRFPGFNDCKDQFLCMGFRRFMDEGKLITVITPFTGLVDHSGTAAAKREYWEKLKRKYALDLKQILTCHPAWAGEIGMTPKQVADFKPEDVAPEIPSDVPGDYRVRK